MKSVILRSPAKLNLFLKVLNKRSDGYHNIKTLFEKINLCDELRFCSNKKGVIRIFCDHPHVPKGPKNLVYQAARLLKEKFCISDGVDLYIRKRIPVAAGLAGGSSNAATTLLGLNKLWRLSLDKGQLTELAMALGSDVPLFLYKGSWALGRGRGDDITPLDIRGKFWHILVIPRLKLYSREVFRHFKLPLTKTKDNVNILIQSLKDYNIKKAQKLLSNDLESSILTTCPRILGLKERLRSHEVYGVTFSGSGPTLFGLTETKQKAGFLKQRLSKRYSQVFAVETLQEEGNN